MNYYDLIIFVNSPSIYESDNKLILEFADAIIYLISTNKVNNKLPKMAMEKIFYNYPHIGIVVNNYYSNNYIKI